MYAEVVRTEQLSPSMIRVVLGGGTLDRFLPSPATDAYVNARFVPEGSPVTVPFDAATLEDVAVEHRPRPRRFTIRRWDDAQQLLAIDFVAHGDVGYAGSWAQRAAPGDRLQFDGPSGSYIPDSSVDWHLLVGDESALGAIGATLEQLPSGRRALVFAVVDGPDHEIDLPTTADATIVWLHRCTASDPDSLLADTVESAEFPSGTFDVFVHGEAAEVRAVRRHLLADRGVDRDTASISPYWRRDHTDEAWRAVKRQWLAEQAGDL